MKSVSPSLTNKEKVKYRGLSNLPKGILQINGKAEIEPRAVWLLVPWLECYFPMFLVLQLWFKRSVVNSFNKYLSFTEQVALW